MANGKDLTSEGLRDFGARGILKHQFQFHGLRLRLLAFDHEVDAAEGVNGDWLNEGLVRLHGERRGVGGGEREQRGVPFFYERTFGRAAERPVKEPVFSGEGDGEWGGGRPPAAE